MHVWALGLSCETPAAVRARDSTKVFLSSGPNTSPTSQCAPVKQFVPTTIVMTCYLPRQARHQDVRLLTLLVILLISELHDSLVSRLCVLHGSRLGVQMFSFCQNCALTAGLTSHPQVSSLRGERVGEEGFDLPNPKWHGCVCRGQLATHFLGEALSTNSDLHLSSSAALPKPTSAFLPSNT